MTEQDHAPVLLLKKTPKLTRRSLFESFFVTSAFGVVFLSGCQPAPSKKTSLPSPPLSAKKQTKGVYAATIGSGRVRIALILPLSADATFGTIAKQMQQAAQLAIDAYGSSGVHIVVYDDRGTSAGAAEAATAAISGGAELIVGPLNANAARAAARIAQQANIPIIALSSDATLAARGVYLIGFLPRHDVHRIIGFAAEKGYRAAAAIVPDSLYGSVVAASFTQAAAEASMKVVAVQKYKLNDTDIMRCAQEIAKFSSYIDCIFVPGDINTVTRVAIALGDVGIRENTIRILGTGQLHAKSDSHDIIENNKNLQRYSSQAPAKADVSATLSGIWYPVSDQSSMQDFAMRYTRAFRYSPLPLAVLSFEAIYLAAALVDQGGAHPFNSENLTRRSGFLGSTGLFRFNYDGTSERSLSVVEIQTNGSVKEVGPGLKSF